MVLRVPRRQSIRLLVISIAIYGGTGVAQADVFDLAGGGRLEGKVIQTDDADKSTYIIDLAGGGRLTIARSQVTRIDSTSEAEAEYQKLALTSPDTVEGHEKLAEWCRQHKLQHEYQQHMARILELNPNHAEARTALGFHNQDGQWMNRDDVMASRGLVMYDGKYVTPQQVEILEQQKKSRVTQADWKNTIEQLRRQLTGRRQDNSAQARVKIQSLKDPAAADAVVAVLHRENDPDLKRLWIETAARLNSRVAIDALVDLSLNDPDDEIRHQCLEYLIKSGRPGLSTPYIRALKDSHNEMVNRAAAALGQIKDRDSIGPLIDALITKHRVKVSDANPDQHAYTFSKDSNAFSFGGGGPQVVNQTFRNQAARDALVAISGANFEYDQEQWRNWLAAQAKVNAVDVRRDP
ncbi:MAG TPA: HEAT repeat domain-containing protein [Lacipirellulaceae bacterium]|nr:HEAT repeat domain-containing protein [Lacipirellulaceae bacterium]